MLKKSCGAAWHGNLISVAFAGWVLLQQSALFQWSGSNSTIVGILLSSKCKIQTVFVQGGPSNASHSKPCLFFWRMLDPGKKTLPNRLSSPSVEVQLESAVGKLEQFIYRLMQNVTNGHVRCLQVRGCRGWDVSVCLVLWAEMLGDESCSHLFFEVL